MQELFRVQKLIAQSGLMSRREAEKMISSGLVFVNGIKASLGDKASADDEIKVNGKILNLTKSPVFKYFLLNKPKNSITTSNDPKGRRTVIDLINTNERIVPVGRLDRNTTGVLLLTTDYELVNKLTHPKYEIERVYRARIDSPLTLKEFKELNAGVRNWWKNESPNSGSSWYKKLFSFTACWFISPCQEAVWENWAQGTYFKKSFLC